VKLLFENWRRFINEEQESSHEIFCDMDGVLVDFEAGAIEHLTNMLQNGEAEDLKAEIKRDYVTKEDLRGKSPIRVFMYKALQHHAGFWENLPWMPGGEELWNFIGSRGVAILTTPLRYGSEIGKQAWIDTHLNPPPVRVFMSKTDDHGKSQKYRWAAPYRILIDDYVKNTAPWEEAGGIAILHTDTTKTIQELEEILNETY